MASASTACICKAMDRIWIEHRCKRQSPTDDNTLGRGTLPRASHVNGANMMKKKGLSTIRRPVINDQCLNFGSL